MWTLPATMLFRYLFTTTSATAGTCWVSVGSTWRRDTSVRGQGGATLCLALQRVQLLPVGGGVDVDGGDARGQAQVAVARDQEGHLQHGVQEGHPVVFPQQPACVTWGGGTVSSARLGLSPSGPSPPCGPLIPTTALPSPSLGI